MAIKYYCDICKSEIEDLNYHGEFKMTDKTFTFPKHKKTDSIKVYNYLLCMKCAGSVKSKITDLIESSKMVKEMQGG